MKTLSYAFKYLLKLRGNNVIKLISITMGLFLGWVFLAKIVYVESYNKSFPDAERIYRVDDSNPARPADSGPDTYRRPSPRP